jgi:CheY-like chemotaxis protein
MSHELRTPLNAIIGFTQLLEMERLTASQSESVSHIARGGEHLLALINQVLDIARIDTGRMTLTIEPVEINGALRESAELIRPLADRHGITVTLDLEESGVAHCVNADRQRLQQVFMNLLSNAVKYNRPNGTVNVSAEQIDDRVRVRFRDTGIGIPSEKMSRLFVPFERLGAEQTPIEGTGIGLALAQRIVGSNNGILTVESTPGEGSTFTVELPSVACSAPAGRRAASPPAAAQTAGTPSKTILYIEDQDMNLRLVERILKLQPHLKLISAMQGSLGIDLAREYRPDVILLDLNLPDMSGDEVLRRLKIDEALSTIPVIMISADALGDRVTQLIAQGAHGYITKPYKVADFMRTVNEALQVIPR